MNQIWKISKIQPSARRLSKIFEIPIWLSQVLLNRGLMKINKLSDFINVDLSIFPSPYNLEDLEEASEILVSFIEKGALIGVVGDYDVDGITSTVLIADFLRKVGATFFWRIPHRLEDGYGFSPAIALEMAGLGVKVVVTVDCGVSDYEGIKIANQLGMVVIVTDHHPLPSGPLVPAKVVVNPQRKTFGFYKELAGVGVAFLLVAGIRAKLRRKGWFFKNLLKEPNLRDILDLVAVGTCGDVVPLLKYNRILVKEGLKVLNKTPRLGFQALVSIARLRFPLSSKDVVFGLVPRLNAPGRLDKADLSLKLFFNEDPGKVFFIAKELEKLNIKRKILGKKILEQILKLLDKRTYLGETSCLVLASKYWHRGLLGIVASRLVEILNKPVLLLKIEGDQATGSGRSVKSFNFQRALSSVDNLLIRYGGHSQAVGVTISTLLLDKLRDTLSKLVEKELKIFKRFRSLNIEAIVSIVELNTSVFMMLEKVEPFGEGNPEILLACFEVRIEDILPIGKKHLKFKLSQGNNKIWAIYFFVDNFILKKGDLVNVAFVPYISYFKGKRLELIIKDIKSI